MCVNFVFIICLLLTGFVQCSSIITRSMIRMPENSSLPSRAPEHLSWEPARLIAESRDDLEYQMIYPLKDEQDANGDVQSRSLDSDTKESHHQEENSTADSNEPFYSKKKKSIMTTESASILDGGKIPKGVETQETDREDNTGKFNSTLTSKEISSQYWNQFKNFSNDFFNQTDPLKHHVGGSSIDKGLYGEDVWGMLRRIYTCVWSAGLVPCFQESFGDVFSPESSVFFQFLLPREPRIPKEGSPEEEFSYWNGKFDSQLSDKDEGRRKLSKKIQLLLPILMMMKMTMLPALAVIALVSGKALLLSLVSLGVALIAGSINPLSLGATKRHEIAPQVPIPSDKLPDNYYYVM